LALSDVSGGGGLFTSLFSAAGSTNNPDTDDFDMLLSPIAHFFDSSSLYDREYFNRTSFHPLPLGLWLPIPYRK
jgi:hypothetical protein